MTSTSVDCVCVECLRKRLERAEGRIVQLQTELDSVRQSSWNLVESLIQSLLPRLTNKELAEFKANVQKAKEMVATRELNK